MGSLIGIAGRGLSTFVNGVMAVTFFLGAVVLLWPGVVDLNILLRGGMAAFFLGRAASSDMLVMVRATRRPSDPEAILRSYVALSYGYVASGVLVGVGAMWYGGILGFIVSGGAFSLAWFWYWFQRRIAHERRTENAAH